MKDFNKELTERIEQYFSGLIKGRQKEFNTKLSLLADVGDLIEQEKIRIKTAATYAGYALREIEEELEKGQSEADNKGSKYTVNIEINPYCEVEEYKMIEIKEGKIFNTKKEALEDYLEDLNNRLDKYSKGELGKQKGSSLMHTILRAVTIRDEIEEQLKEQK